MNDLDPDDRAINSDVEDTKNSQQTRGVSDSVSPRPLGNQKKWFLNNSLFLGACFLGGGVGALYSCLRYGQFFSWLPIIISSMSILMPMAVDLVSGLYNLRANQRKSIKQHVQSQSWGTSWPVFYGLDIFIIYILVTGFLLTVVRQFAYFSGVINDDNPVPFSLSLLTKLLMGLALNNLHLAWVHSVTSRTNNNKSLWQRIPSRQSWLKTAPAASMDIVLPSLTQYLAGKITPPYLLATLIPFATGLLVSVITEAIYIRIAMTTLPEDAEPMLCSSDGWRSRLKKGQEGYVLGVLDAFRGMESQNWYRYLKAIGEVVLHEADGLLLFLAVILLELFFLQPKTFGSLLASLMDWIESHGIR